MKKSILSAMLLLASVAVSAAELTFVTTIGAPVGVFETVTSSEKGYVNQLNFLTIKNGAESGNIALHGKEGEDNVYAKLGKVFLTGAETATLHSDHIAEWNSQGNVLIRRGDIDVKVASLNTGTMRFCEPTGSSACVAENATLGAKLLTIKGDSTVGPAALNQIKESKSDGTVNTWFPNVVSGTSGYGPNATATWEPVKSIDSTQTDGKYWVLQATTN